MSIENLPWSDQATGRALCRAALGLVNSIVTITPTVLEYVGAVLTGFSILFLKIFFKWLTAYLRDSWQFL